MESLVVCVPMTAESEVARRVFAAWSSTVAVGWFEWVEPRRMAFFNGTMILCRLTALLGGFVQAALALAIQNMLTSGEQKQAMQTLPFFTEHAASTAFTVRTGITGTSPLSLVLL